MVSRTSSTDVRKNRAQAGVRTAGDQRVPDSSRPHVRLRPAVGSLQDGPSHQLRLLSKYSTINISINRGARLTKAGVTVAAGVVQSHKGQGTCAACEGQMKRSL